MREILKRKPYLSIFVFFILLQTALYLPADQRDHETESALLTASEKLGELQAEQLQAFYTWTTAMRLFAQFRNSSVSRPLKDYIDPKRFYGLNRTDQSQLRKELPAIEQIEMLVNERYLSDLTAASDKQKNIIKELQKKIKPESVKKIFRQYHDEKINLKYADLDTILGLDYESAEAQVDQNKYPQKEAWIGAPKFQTQTDYNKIRKVFSVLTLDKSDVFYDLGSGYGRVIFYGGLINPEVTFKGVEYVKERVVESQKLARRLKVKNVSFIARDVLKQDLSDGTVFYIFNSFPSIMHEVLKNLKKVAGTRTIRIVAVGRTAVELKHVDWLKIDRRLDYSELSEDIIIYTSGLK